MIAHVAGAHHLRHRYPACPPWPWPFACSVPISTAWSCTGASGSSFASGLQMWRGTERPAQWKPHPATPARPSSSTDVLAASYSTVAACATGYAGTPSTRAAAEHPLDDILPARVVDAPTCSVVLLLPSETRALIVCGVSLLSHRLIPLSVARSRKRVSRARSSDAAADLAPLGVGDAVAYEIFEQIGRNRESCRYSLPGSAESGRSWRRCGLQLSAKGTSAVASRVCGSAPGTGDAHWPRRGRCIRRRGGAARYAWRRRHETPSRSSMGSGARW